MLAQEKRMGFDSLTRFTKYVITASIYLYDAVVGSFVNLIETSACSLFIIIIIIIVTVIIGISYLGIRTILDCFKFNA